MIGVPSRGKDISLGHVRVRPLTGLVPTRSYIQGISVHVRNSLVGRLCTHGKIVMLSRFS